MKATYKTLTLFLSLILIAGSSMAININTGSMENDITRNTNLTDKSQPDVKAPIAEKTTFNLLDEPEFWVNFLKSSISKDFETTEAPLNVVNEMETNPTFWVDYLTTITIEE
ncbi:MAG: hypothetical protein AB9842_07555 [Bacteroidales bacterium]